MYEIKIIIDQSMWNDRSAKHTVQNDFLSFEIREMKTANSPKKRIHENLNMNITRYTVYINKVSINSISKCIQTKNIVT